MQKIKENTAISKIIAAALALVILISGISAIIISHVYKSANAANTENELNTYEVTLKSNYSESDNSFFEQIRASDYTLNIGKTKPNYVVAKFNKDFTEVTISKNGNDSDGLMQDGAFVDVGTGDIANYPLESILEKAEILDGVKNIGDSTFKSCKALTSVAIPDSVTSIGSEAFRDCYNLESAKIPVGVTEIKYAAFFSCQQFKSIEIPDTVTTVSDTAFGDCRNLTSITIPKNVTNISPRAFFCSSKLSNINVAEGNENYSSVDGVLFTKDKTSLVC